jgi:hypothetical protein
VRRPLSIRASRLTTAARSVVSMSVIAGLVSGRAGLRPTHRTAAGLFFQITGLAPCRLSRGVGGADKAAVGVIMCARLSLGWLLGMGGAAATGEAEVEDALFCFGG